MARKKPPYRTRKDRNLRFRYGITLAEYEQMLADSPQCPICQHRPAWVVDHSHDSGEVRGLLCKACNATLGALKDCPAACRRAADYLERSKGNE